MRSGRHGKRHAASGEIRHFTARRDAGPRRRRRAASPNPLHSRGQVGVAGNHRHRVANDGRPETITWTAHPRGVEIRTPSRSTWIPRDEIARIDCADSLFGPVSQLQLIRKRTSKAGIIGSTPVLYVRGTVDARRAQWRAFRAAVGVS
jgi:hypothetical protein